MEKYEIFDIFMLFCDLDCIIVYDFIDSFCDEKIKELEMVFEL